MRSLFLSVPALAAVLALPTIASGITLNSTNSFSWNVDEDDHGEVINGSPDTFDSFPNMCLAPSLALGSTCSSVTEEYEVSGWSGTTEESGQEIVMDSLTRSGLTVSRKIYSPTSGSETFLRYLEVLTNPTGSPITVDVRIGSTATSADLGCRNTALPTACVINASSSGDLVATDNEFWWVIDDDASPNGNNSSTTDNAVGFVVGQAGGAHTAWTTRATDAYGNGDSGDSFVQFESVTIPANSTGIIMWFLVQRLSSADAAADAAVLASLDLSSQALTGMSAAEQSQVLNWGMTQSGGNVDPVADPGGPYSAPEGTAISFIDGSTDSDGTIASWSWSFGDGNSSGAQNPSQPYGDNGTFTVSLEVTDDDGATNTASTTATISNVAPSVTANVQGTAFTGDVVSMSGSFSDPGPDDTQTFAWSFGDGGTDSSTLSPQYTWTSPGSYTVSLTVTDDDGGVGVASHTIVVSNANSAPVAVTDNPTVAEDSGVNSIFVLANDTDADGDPLSLINVSSATNGFTALNGSSVDYTPNSDYFGPDSFTYEVSDGTVTVTGTVNVTVTSVNDLPVAVTTGPYAGTEGTPLTLGDSSFDTDGTVTAWAWDFGDGTTDTAQNPTKTWADSGTFTVTLTVTDNDGGTGTTTIDAFMANAPPTATATIPANGSTGNAVSLTGAYSDSGTADTHTFLWDFGDGTTDTALSPTKTWTTPATYTVVFTVTDDDGDSASDSAPITIVDSNNPPMATDDSATVAEDSGANAIDVLANDTDPDGDVLTITSVDTPSNGTAVVNGAVIDYTPNADFEGADSFLYEISDGAQVSSATVSIVITPTNDAPVGIADVATVLEDSGTSQLDVIGNDEDVDGDALSLVSVAAGTGGTTAVNGDQIDYTPDPDFFGTDTFTYTITDGNLTGSGSVTVTVTGVQDAPVAVDDVGNVAEDAPATLFSVLANDIDVDGDTLSLTSVGPQSAGGTATIAGDDISYTPAAGYIGIETVEYAISDGQGGTDVGLLTVTVGPPNSPPSVPVPVSPVSVTVADAFPELTWVDSTDPEGDVITYAVEVWDGDLLSVITDADGILDSSGPNAAWTVDTELADGEYAWRVMAMDATGDSAFSDDAFFTVNTSNLAPGDVVITAPEDGDDIDGLSPTITWTETTDPDGDAITYIVQVDSVATFDGPDFAEASFAHTGDGSQSWDLGADGIELAEDAPGYARAWAMDAIGTAGGIDSVTFFVRGDNDAPPVPTLVSPIDADSPTGARPELLVTTELDPEGDAVSVDFAVFSDAAGTVEITTMEDVAVVADSTGWTVNVDLEGDFYWTARAVDDFGAESDWAPLAAARASEAPGDDDDSAGDDDDDDDDDVGCDSCQSSVSADAPPRTLALLALILLGIAPRRRRA